MVRSKFIIFAAALLFTVSCGAGSPRNAETFTLPSGKQVKVNSVGKMNFARGDAALVVNYETEIPIENLEPPRNEANEVWGVFQADAERAGLEAGVVRATHYEGGGVVRNGKGYGFVYTKGGAGKWRLQQ